MFITSYEARRDRALTHGPLFYSLKLETVVTADEMHAIREILNGRSDVTLIETPSEAPVPGTMGETVFASGSTPATTAKTEPLSDWCPCGIWRADCTHHKIRHEGDPKP